MKGRTYRYMQAEPLYPFGYGLSYTQFTYTDIKLSAITVKKNQPVEVMATIMNSGKVEGEEVTQLYITNVDATGQVPLYSLRGISRIKLMPGRSEVVKFTVTPDMLVLVNDKGESVLNTGKYKISIGGSLPGNRSVALGMTPSAQTVLTVK
jgi:beta-glucosidase